MKKTTMNTIIEKIRAEIERRIKEDYSSGDERDETAQGVCASILFFLSDLEKEEKPIDGLEEEIRSERKKLMEVFGPMNGEQVLALKDFARHFAKWGAEHRGSSGTP